MAITVFLKELQKDGMYFKEKRTDYELACSKEDKAEILRNLPTEYEGKIEIPSIYYAPNYRGIFKLAKTVQMFNKNLFVEPLGETYYLLSYRTHLEPTGRYNRSISLASTNSTVEMAEYLRRYWCIPLKQKYAPIPNTVEKLNKWLREYGAKGRVINTAYKSEKEIRELAVQIGNKVPSVVKIWSPEEEQEVLYKANSSTGAKENWTSKYNYKTELTPQTTLTEIPSTVIVCRVLKKYEDNSYLIEDMNYQTKRISREQLKQAMSRKQLDVIDLQIDKADRLVRKKVDLEGICRKELKAGYCASKELIFYSLAFIKNLSNEQKEKYLKKIKATYEIDAEDFSNMFIHNNEFTYENYARLDTQARDSLVYFLYQLVGMKPW